MRALDGLRTLSTEMHENSGIDSPFSDWMTGMFGKWKNLIMSVLLSVATFIGILVTCGCFCVPCIRSLCVRCITSTIEKKAPQNPPPYQMPLDEQDERTGYTPLVPRDDEEYVDMHRFK